MALDVSYLTAAGAGASVVSFSLRPATRSALSVLYGWRDGGGFPLGWSCRTNFTGAAGAAAVIVLFCSRLFNRFRAARSRRIDHRQLSAHVATGNRHRRRHRYHSDGTEFPWCLPPCIPVAGGKIPGARSASQPIRRLCHGPGLCIRVDAMHRAGARTDSGACRSPGYCCRRRLLLAIYSLGLGIPFIVAALFSGMFMRFLTRFRMPISAR